MLLFVLRRVCSPCNKWGSVELAPDSPTGLLYHHGRFGVGSVGSHIMAQYARPCFVRRGGAEGPTGTLPDPCAPAPPTSNPTRWQPSLALLAWS